MSLPSLPATQKAIVMDGKSASLVHDRAIPTPPPGHLLVRVHAVALNPTDWKAVERRNHPGLLVGVDYAGVVVRTGTGYDKPWAAGDRICGYVFGSNKLRPESGAFAEYIVVKADNALRTPADLRDQEAATLGVGYQTCGQGLFFSMGLDLERLKHEKGMKGKDDVVLIYGGSSATGSLGIQYATLAGYRVITTCSPRHFDFVKSLGAVEVFDYNDPEAVEKIKTYCNNNLKYVWDTISKDSTAEFCAKVIATGGIYRALMWPLNFTREDVSSDWTAASTTFGDPVDLGSLYKRDDTTKDFEFSKAFTTITDRLLTQDKLKTHPGKVHDTGLEGVMDGLDLLKREQVSGQKLVYLL